MHKRAEIHKKRNYFLRRKAFDYCFLIEHFNLKDRVPKSDDMDFEDSEVLKNFFKEVLEKHSHECNYSSKNCKCGLKSVAKDLRMYLKNLAKWGHTYWTPVWKGMSKVEDDGELLIISSILVSAMWD